MEACTALEALFPGSRHAILRTIFLEPERWWTSRELSERLACNHGRVARQAGALARGGVLLQRQADSVQAYRANPHFPFFAEVQAMAAKCVRPHRGGGGETILVVEDEPATAKITRILLESWGYKVLEAHSPEQALKLFGEHAADIRLLLADVMMPGMSGPQLAARLRAVSPGLRVLLMSGRYEEDLASNPQFLAKPFNPAGLARKIRQELDR